MPSLAAVAAAFPQLEILSQIGQGGMGVVFKARQPGLDRVVALKILCPELGRDPAFAERFAREARVLAKLNHPNIVSVFEHGECGGFFYLLMEYVDGVNLRQAMRAGRFTPEQALAVVPGICDALQAAHAQGIWHRDIKPENILLDSRGAVKIVDFGIARLVGDPARDFTLTRTGAALGSAPYMAPEQHEKPHEVDHRADIYSLGVVIYEMLTGELPLGRFPAPSRRAAVSARIDEIVFQTLEKERELRQQSAAEVKTDVHRATRDGDGGSAKRHATPPRSRGMASLLAWAVGLLMIAVVLWANHEQSTSETARDLTRILLGLSVLFSAIGGIVAIYLLRPDRLVGLLGAGLVLLVLLLVIEGRGAVSLALFAAIMAVSGGLGAWLIASPENEMKTRALDAPERVTGGRAGAGSGLPFALLLLILTSAVLLGGLALMTGYDFPSEKGWVLGMGCLVFAATAGVLYFPLGSLRKRWAGFLTRFKRLHWGLAAVAIVAAAWVAKKLDGNWPNANYLEVVSGRVEGKPPSLALLPLLQQAAGTRAGAYGLSVTGPSSTALKPVSAVGSDFQISTMATQPGHAVACAERLKQLLPASVGIHWELNSSGRDHDVWVRATNNSRALVWGVASLAAILTTLLGGRRTGWLVVGGAVLHGWLMLMPVWPLAGSPKQLTDPPLQPFAAVELPETVDLSTPEMAVATLFDAAKRGQANVARKAVSNDLGAALDKINHWQVFMDRNRDIFAKATEHQLDTAWNLTTCTVDRDGNVETLFMAQEDGVWKVDSLNFGGRRIGPFSLGVPKASPQAAVPQQPGDLDPEATLRKLNTLANESNGEEFAKYCDHQRLTTSTIQSMEWLLGTVVRSKCLSNDKAFARIIAEIKHPDGAVEVKEMLFSYRAAGRTWLFASIETPPYRAFCRIGFQPDKGDANAILRTHQGNARIYPVSGAAGQFDLYARGGEPQEAAAEANAMAEALHESLKKFNLDASFKILKPAAIPLSRWPDDETPTAEKPTP